MGLEIPSLEEFEELIDRKVSPILERLNHPRINLPGLEPLLNAKQAAKLLGCKEGHLAKLRTNGSKLEDGGLKYVDISEPGAGRPTIRYDVLEIKAYIERRTRKHTSDPGKEVKQA